jgi:hypothetical protein
MPTSTLKRTAATIGLLASVLAAAAPASAQLPPSSSGVTAFGGRPDAPLQDSAFCVGDGVAAKCTNWGAIYDHGITQATQTGSEHGLIAYNGHAGLGGNGLAFTPPIGSNKGSFTASGGWFPTRALNSQGIVQDAVATTVVGGVVPGGAIVSA